MKSLLLFFLIAYTLPTVAQQTDPRQETITHYKSILTAAPREKIYVHFDKPTYLNTDTIWFKAYLVNASVHIPSTVSNLIYTELINESGEVVKRLSLPTVLGLTWGSFLIETEHYKPGKYTFRAYTNWMQNFGTQYLFQKNLTVLPTGTLNINTANSNIINSKKTTKLDSSVKERLQDIDVQFLPEGGNWLINKQHKISFKALNTNGKGIPVHGEIINSKQSKVASFSSNAKGMGAFNLSALQGEVYSAKVNHNGITKTIPLPIPLNEGTSLKLENEFNNDSLTVTAFSTFTGQEVMIVGQSRGIICFVSRIKFNGIDAKSIKIAKNIFPTGVCQVIILNDKRKILNERNFFVNNQDQLQLQLSSAQLTYKLRDSIPIQIKVNDKEKKSQISALSIAVTDNQQVAKDTLNDNNILSYFLLNSDVKGEIERPGYYFHQPNAETHQDLDALMLTQGWVSYEWDMSKDFPYAAEKEYSISGKVTNIMNKPLAKAKIILLGNNKEFMIRDTLTNDKGEFIFNKLPILDSASFVIQAKNEKGKKGTAGIVVNEFNPPPFVNVSRKKITPNQDPIDSISKNLIATKTEEYKLTGKDVNKLNEVVIVGKRAIKGSKNLNGPGEADLTITDEELSKIYKKTLYNVLEEKVKGFRAAPPKGSNDRIFFINFNWMKLIIDGVEVDFFYEADGSPESYYHYIKYYLDYYQAEDIQGIEVMNGRKFSSSYHMKFMDPLDPLDISFIEVTTKSGQGPFLKKSANLYLFKPVNYGHNRVFYSPKYTFANKTSERPDFRSTIYWNPNLLTNEKGEGTFSFFAADKPGNYTVWIEGTDLDGNFAFKTLNLKIIN